MTYQTQNTVAIEHRPGRRNGADMTHLIVHRLTDITLPVAAKDGIRATVACDVTSRFVISYPPNITDSPQCPYSRCSQGCWS